MSKQNKLNIQKPDPFNLKGIVVSDDSNGDKILEWPPVQFGIPNKLLRSAVFGVQREKRDGVLDKFNFTYRDKYEITYTGSKLNQDDSIVWQAILKAVKNTNSGLGKIISIKKSDVLNCLNKTNGGENYKWLLSCLDKLATANLKCVNGKSVFSSNLIVGYSLDESNAYFKAGISGFLEPLLSEDLTDIDLLRKSKLSSQLSKWLHDFYSSHTKPIPYSVEKLHKMCRSNQNMAKFKMSLKKSIEDLKKCTPKLISDNSYVDVKSNIVYVFKESNSPYVPSKLIENGKILLKNKEVVPQNFYL